MKIVPGLETIATPAAVPDVNFAALIIQMARDNRNYGAKLDADLLEKLGDCIILQQAYAARGIAMKAGPIKELWETGLRYQAITGFFNVKNQALGLSPANEGKHP